MERIIDLLKAECNPKLKELMCEEALKIEADNIIKNHIKKQAFQKVLSVEEKEKQNDEVVKRKIKKLFLKPKSIETIQKYNDIVLKNKIKSMYI